MLIQCSQGNLALHGVVLGGDVAEGADHDSAPGFGIVDVVEVDRDPQPMPVAVGNGNGEGAVGLAQQLRERRFDLSVGVGVGVGVRPPRVGSFIGQLFGAVAEDLGEGGVDLDDGTVLVADKERFLQRVDQGGAPAGVMVAQPRQLDVGAYPGKQLRGGEWFDEVVVRAGQQAFDRGVLSRASGQQQDG